MSVQFENNAHEHNEDAGTIDDLKDKSKKMVEAVKGNPIPFAIGVGVLVGAIGTCVYCKFCRGNKDEEAEGGEPTDRQVFKKQVKSKSSHKRHTKESLVPAFKVADEQA